MPLSGHQNQEPRIPQTAGIGTDKPGFATERTKKMTDQSQMNTVDAGA